MNQKLSMSDLGRISPDEFRGAEKAKVIVVLDNIRSGLNVGSIFRSADAFRIDRIICCGYTPVPPHREVLKSALGATETVKWEFQEKVTDVIAALKANGVKVFAVEQVKGSRALHTFQLDGHQWYAIVLGNEVHGVQQEAVDACDGAIEVAQFGTKHSLNVAVCAGIVLFHFATANLQG